MIDILKFIGIGMGIIVAASVSYFMFNKNKEGENPTGRVIVIHYMPEQSGGHSVGVAENWETLGERIKIDFIPRSINYQKEINKNKRLGIDKKITIKTYPLFFDKDLVDIHSDMDDHVTIIEAYPQDIEQVPKGVALRKPEILERINKVNMKKDNIDLYKARIRNANNMALENFSGKMERIALLKHIELMKDFSQEKNGETKQNDKK